MRLRGHIWDSRNNNFMDDKFLKSSLRYKEGLRKGIEDKQSGKVYKNPFHGIHDHAFHGYKDGWDKSERIFILKDVD
jgi:hypothetical protein